MKGLFIPEITAEIFRNGCLESIEALMAEGKIYDIDYQQPCEDCISREAVMHILDEVGRDFDTPREAVIPIDYMADMVADLPSVTPWSSWIPVSEKLPEPLTAVLLTVRYKSTGHWTYQMGYWEDALEKWERWLEIGTLDDEFDILAWMELPEKYEEDKYE